MLKACLYGAEFVVGDDRDPGPNRARWHRMMAGPAHRTLRHAQVRRYLRASLATPAPLELHASRWNAPVNGARAGGDWSEIVSVSDDILSLSVGDVAGHGEPASGMMDVLRSAIVDAVWESRQPAQILALANSVAFAGGDGLIATGIVGFIDRRRRTFTFASAGHPAPLLVTRRGHAFLSHAPGDLPLGINALHRSAQYVVALPSDAILSLYTDGLTELRRDIFAGERDLVSACRRAYENPERAAARVIAESILSAGSGNDDAAIVAVRTASGDALSRRVGAAQKCAIEPAP